jgi:hypothetical protein
MEELWLGSIEGYLISFLFDEKHEYVCLDSLFWFFEN